MTFKHLHDFLASALHHDKPNSYFYAKYIFESTGQLPNLNPATPLRIGDFGILNNSSGAFTVEGNIFHGDTPLHGRIPEVERTEIDSIECKYSNSKDHSRHAAAGGYVSVPIVAKYRFLTQYTLYAAARTRSLMLMGTLRFTILKNTAFAY